jgi:hypothetical protein
LEKDERVVLIGQANPLASKDIMKPKTRRLGKLILSWDLLHDLLKLPDDTTMCKLYEDYENPYTFSLVVESPNLPETIEGAMIPKVTLQELSGFDE